MLIFPRGGTLASKSGMSMHKQRKQFTTLQRNIASSTLFVFRLDYQHICHSPVIYSLFLPEEYEKEKKDKCTCQNVKQMLEQRLGTINVLWKKQQAGLGFGFSFLQQADSEKNANVKQRKQQCCLAALLRMCVMI